MHIAASSLTLGFSQGCGSDVPIGMSAFVASEDAALAPLGSANVTALGQDGDSLRNGVSYRCGLASKDLVSTTSSSTALYETALRMALEGRQHQFQVPHNPTSVASDSTFACFSQSSSSQQMDLFAAEKKDTLHASPAAVPQSYTNGNGFPTPLPVLNRDGRAYFSHRYTSDGSAGYVPSSGHHPFSYDAPHVYLPHPALSSVAPSQFNMYNRSCLTPVQQQKVSTFSADSTFAFVEPSPALWTSLAATHQTQCPPSVISNRTSNFTTPNMFFSPVEALGAHTTEAFSGMSTHPLTTSSDFCNYRLPYTPNSLPQHPDRLNTSALLSDSLPSGAPSLSKDLGPQRCLSAGRGAAREQFPLHTLNNFYRSFASQTMKPPLPSSVQSSENTTFLSDSRGSVASSMSSTSMVHNPNNSFPLPSASQASVLSSNTASIQPHHVAPNTSRIAYPAPTSNCNSVAAVNSTASFRNGVTTADLVRMSADTHAQTLALSDTKQLSPLRLMGDSLRLPAEYSYNFDATLTLSNSASSSSPSEHGNSQNEKRTAGRATAEYLCSFPGVSWNTRMQSWLVYYEDMTGRKSKTFNPKRYSADKLDKSDARYEKLKHLDPMTVAMHCACVFATEVRYRARLYKHLGLSFTRSGLKKLKAAKALASDINQQVTAGVLRNTEATQRATVLEAKSSSPSQPVNLDGYDRSPAPLQLCQTGVFSASSSNTPFSTTNVNYPVQPRLVRFAENSHFSMESAATSLENSSNDVKSLRGCRAVITRPQGARSILTKTQVDIDSKLDATKDDTLGTKTVLNEVEPSATVAAPPWPLSSSSSSKISSPSSNCVENSNHKWPLRCTSFSSDTSCGNGNRMSSTSSIKRSTSAHHKESDVLSFKSESALCQNDSNKPLLNLTQQDDNEACRLGGEQDSFVDRRCPSPIEEYNTAPVLPTSHHAQSRPPLEIYEPTSDKMDCSNNKTSSYVNPSLPQNSPKDTDPKFSVIPSWQAECEAPSLSVSPKLLSPDTTTPSVSRIIGTPSLWHPKTSNVTAATTGAFSHSRSSDNQTSLAFHSQPSFLAFSNTTDSNRTTGEGVRYNFLHLPSAWSEAASNLSVSSGHSSMAACLTPPSSSLLDVREGAATPCASSDAASSVVADCSGETQQTKSLAADAVQPSPLTEYTYGTAEGTGVDYNNYRCYGGALRLLPAQTRTRVQRVSPFRAALPWVQRDARPLAAHRTDASLSTNGSASSVTPFPVISTAPLSSIASSDNPWC